MSWRWLVDVVLPGVLKFFQGHDGVGLEAGFLAFQIGLLGVGAVFEVTIAVHVVHDHPRHAGGGEKQKAESRK